MTVRGGPSAVFLDEDVRVTLASGSGVPVSDTAPLPVALVGQTSTLNSSTTPLAAAGTFTGTGELNAYADAFIACQTDQDGILYLDTSVDGTNWGTQRVVSLDAGLEEQHSILKAGRYFRVRVQNTSASPQTYLRLKTYYGQFRQLNSALNSTIREDADSHVVRTISDELDISSGRHQGYSIVNKFGTNVDVDVASLPEDIWNSGSAYTGFPDSTLETVSVVSDNVNDTLAGTGARTVRFIGLDGNYNIQTEDINLNGVTPVAGLLTFRRVHTAQVIAAGSGGVNAGTLTFRHTTTVANVFLSIVPGRNQSNCSAYTVPAGYTAYMRQLHCAIRGTTQTSTVVAAEGGIWTRAFGAPFRLRRPWIVSDRFRLSDTIFGGIVFTEKSDIVLRITASTESNVSVNGGYDLLLVKNIV